MNCRGCMAICTTSKKPTVPENCAGYIPKTHGNLLRSMSDEELAENIGESIDCGVCKTMHHSESGECPSRSNQSCVDFWLDWLKQEAWE